MKLPARILSFLLPALLLLTSCHKDSNINPLPDNLFGAFATLTAATSDGASFQVWNEGAYGESVIFTTAWKDQDLSNYKVGNRYYIYYTNGTTDQPLKPGNVSLYMVAQCQNGGVTPASSETILSQSVGTYICNYEPTLTGMYVNVLMAVSLNARSAGLLVDESTLTGEYPDIYLCADADPIISSGREVFGSFSIESIWQLPSAKGITLHYELNGQAAAKRIDKIGFAPAN